jgi:hypothetical protein
MRVRRVVSLTVFLSFIFLALSGVMLFLSPQGRVAYWAGWTLFGLDKDQYSAIHTTFMVLFLTVGVWHIALNWKPITGYLKNRSKQFRLFTPESSLALALALVFLAGSLLGMPPFKQFLDAGQGVKDYWEGAHGSPPWGHAEESSLQRFCRGMEDYERVETGRLVTVDCDRALSRLRAEGFTVEGLDQRLLDVAETNGTTPQALAAVIMGVAVARAGEETEGQRVPPAPEVRFRRPYTGLGRMTLAGYAAEFGYDVKELQEILADAGIQLDPQARLREEASRLGTDPEGIIDLLNTGSEG